MNVCGNVQLVLHFLPVLVIGYFFRRPSANKICLSIGCLPYKTNETGCIVLGYVGDPVTSECIPKCTGPCNMEKCEFCFCQLPKDEIPTEKLFGCPYVYNIDKTTTWYTARDINYCNNDYFISPYDEGECVRRCSTHSCNNGLCSSQGTCVCHLGYRPDPMNPRTCTRIPTNPPNPQRLSCDEGYKPNINGDCSPSCTNQCKNETCDPNSDCQCPEGYEFDNTTSGCEMQPNNTADDARNSNGIRIMPNMSIIYEEKMEEMTLDLYTPISASIIAILLATVIVLVFILIKLKQTIRKEVNLHQGQNEEVYSPNYYSALSFEKKPDDGVVVENVELYGKSS